jgi:hypothetical protein
MGSTNATPSILFLGLPSHHPLVPAAVQDMVELGLRETQRQADAAGVHMQQVMVSPDELPTVEAALKAKAWDGVIIGNGVRSNLDLTHYMEQLIVAIREYAPQAVLMFNTMPLTCMDAIRRWYPHVKEA